MIVAAIDPGQSESGFAVVDIDAMKVRAAKKFPNDEVLGFLWGNRTNVLFDILVIETIQSYGKPVGQSTFDTLIWIGRFIQACGGEWTGITRQQVIRELFGSTWYAEDGKRTKYSDSHVRQNIIEEFGGESAIGGVRCKKCNGKGWFGAGRPACPQCEGGKWDVPPGPLYGVSKDAWSAIAVAVAYQKQIQGIAQ